MKEFNFQSNFHIIRKKGGGGLKGKREFSQKETCLCYIFRAEFVGKSQNNYFAELIYKSNVEM